MNQFHGVFPAVLTAFDAEGSFDAPRYEAIIDHLYKQGVDGLYVCGVTGEGLMMSPEEREQVAEVAVAASSGRGQAIIHVGCGNTADAIRLTRHAVRIGAAGIGCLAPYTSHFSPTALVEHFTAVAQAAEPIPAMVYYTPQTAPSLNSYAVLERLLNLPGISGVKFTGTDASELAYAILERSPTQTVLTGVDEMFFASLLMGAHGDIGSFVNLAPQWFVSIRQLVGAGNLEEARLLQSRLNRLIRTVESYPFLSALKCVVRRFGFECGEPRRPHQRLTPEQQDALWAEAAPLLGGR